MSRLLSIVEAIAIAVALALPVAVAAFGG